MASSTKTKRRSAVQLAADGFAAIVEKLGMAEAIRFVQLYHQGIGHYTRERHNWLDMVSHDEIANRMANLPKMMPRKRKRAPKRKRGR
jgi:hypothetical protein